MMFTKKMIPSLLLMVSTSLAYGEFSADFEKSINATNSAGKEVKSLTTNLSLVKSKYGQSLKVSQNGGAIYNALNNISLQSGTISFDYAPDWNGNDYKAHVIFALYTGNKQNYFQISKLGARGASSNAIGGAFVAGKKIGYIANEKGQRLNIADWKANEFHKIELAWNSTNYYFKIDGKQIFTGSRPAFEAPINAKSRIVFGESATGLYDNIKISTTCNFNFNIDKTASSIPDKDMLYLSDIADLATIEHPNLVHKNKFPTTSGELPIVINGDNYKKALFTFPPNKISYKLDGKFARFRSVVGINDTAVLRGSTMFKVYGDGKLLAQSYRTRRDEPKQLDVDIKGVKVLELVCFPGVDDFGDHAIWYDPMILKANVAIPEPSIFHKTSEKTKTLTQAEVDADFYVFKGRDLENLKSGVLVTERNVVDDFDPNRSHVFKDNITMKSFVAPDQFENIGFALGFGEDMDNLSIVVEPLKDNKGNQLDNLKVRYCMRAIEGLRTWSSKSEVSSRFLREFESLKVRKGDFREFFIRVNAPKNAVAGLYTGNAKVLNGDKFVKNIPIEIELFDIDLELPNNKIVGMYYDMGRTIENKVAFDAEMQDLLEHKTTMLFLGDYMCVHFNRNEDGKLIPDTTKIEEALAELKRVGFKGKIVVSCELGEVLDRFYDIKDGVSRTHASKDALINPDYMNLAKDTMLKLKDLQEQNPDFEFIITTMDEIFNHGRLPIFITAIKAAQQVPGFKYYATFHFVNDAADKMRAEVAPYIAYRNHHMVSWEWYLARGNTFEEYQKELDKYDSIAGAYYNPIGSLYRPSWFRLVMGLEFVEGPLTFQMPWTYYSSLGNPFAWPSSRDSYIFGFYSKEDNAMVSTRLWEASRSGIDDIRYFAALKKAIKTNEKSNPQLAKEAKIFYENTMADIPKPQGLPTGGYLRGSSTECPWTGLLSYVYDNEKLQNIRKQCAYYILKLNKKIN